MPSIKRKGLSSREYERKMQMKALKNKSKTLKTGFIGGKAIDYSNPKYKGYTLSSLD